MKKSVVVLIAIIYVASIALVTFFGLQHNTFFEDKKVSQVTITNENLRTTSTGDKYISLLPDENGNRTFQIKYEVSPNDATNTGVDFVIDEQNAYASVDENGLVTFTKGNWSAIVYVIAKDGSGASDKLEVTFMR